MMAALGIPDILLFIAIIGGVVQGIVHSMLLKRERTISHGAWLTADVVVGIAVLVVVFGPFPVWNWWYGLVLMAGAFSFAFRVVLNSLMKWGLFHIGTTANYDQFFRFIAFLFDQHANLAEQVRKACYAAMVAECIAMLWGFISITQ